MNILAIDTVTEMCSVALISGERTFADAQLVPQRHTHVVLGMIEDLLGQAKLPMSGLDAVSFSRGPGSFTGLRICASITQALSLAHDLPVIPLSSLAILAQGAFRQDKHRSILACMDARKNEVYWGCYRVEDEHVVLAGTEQVSAPAQVKLPANGGWHGVGTGFSRFSDELNLNSLTRLVSIEAERYPLAYDMLALAKRSWQRSEVVDASSALPVYLRDDVAQPKEPLIKSILD